MISGMREIADIANPGTTEGTEEHGGGGELLKISSQIGVGLRDQDIDWRGVQGLSDHRSSCGTAALGGEGWFWGFN